MLTPATRASRTSAPLVIISYAFCTHVTLPPFLNLLPLAADTTTGLTDFGVNIVGAWDAWDAAPRSVRGAAAARPTAAVVWTNSRRFSFFITPRRYNVASTFAAIIIRC